MTPDGMARFLEDFRIVQSTDAEPEMLETHASIYTVVLPCHVCSRPHHLVASLVTRSDRLSPECWFTLPKSCVSCGSRLDSPVHDDEVRNTVACLVWAEHHGVIQ